MVNDDDDDDAGNLVKMPAYFRWSSDGRAKNQLGELFFGRQTIGRQARTVRRQQIGRLGDIVQMVGRNM